MDLETVTSNPDYFKNGYPESWQRGYTAGLQGELIPASGASKDPAWHNGHTRGTADRNTQPTKENSMTVNTEKTEPAAGDVDLDALAGELEQESQQTAAENAGNQTTSAGGFGLLDGLEDDLDKGSGKAWIPETVGQTLLGIVEGVDSIQSEYPNPKTGQFDMLPLVDVRDRDGELYSVRGYGAALAAQLKKADPKVGDGIAIRFLGMEQPKNAGYREYKNYAVRVKRANAS